MSVQCLARIFLPQAAWMTKRRQEGTALQKFYSSWKEMNARQGVVPRAVQQREEKEEDDANESPEEEDLDSDEDEEMEF